MNASSQKTLVPILIAFAAGVVGTSVVMSQRHAAPMSTEAKPDAAKEDAAASPTNIVTLAPEAQKNAGIRVEAVTIHRVADAVDAPATVEADPSRVAEVTPPASGTVKRLLVSTGSRVQAGQPLAVVDSYEVAQARAAVRDAHLAVLQAQSGVATAVSQRAQAETRVQGAQAFLLRQRKLAAAGGFSQPPLLTASSAVAAAKSDRDQAQAALDEKTKAWQRAGKLYKVAVISTADFELAESEYRQAQARTEAAQQQVTIAQQALDREQRISRGNMLSNQAVQSAEADLASARSDVRTAESQVRAAETAFRVATDREEGLRSDLRALAGSDQVAAGGGFTLMAPIGGIVTDIAVTTGQSVERSTRLLGIGNTSAVVVQANVPELDAAVIRAGLPVRVTVPAYPGRVFTGVVRTVGSSLDEKTRTLPVRCMVDNPDGRLKPEMFATASLATTRLAPAMTIPASAVDEDGDADFAYIQTHDGFERRPIAIGIHTGDRVTVTSGLKPGDMVVTAGTFVLRSELKKDELKGDDD